MYNFCKIRRRGFTLVELLIAMAVGTVIMAAVYSAMNLALRFSANTDRKVITQQDTRAVLDLMAMEIRMASFNPSMQSTTWTGIPATVTGCANVTSGAWAVAPTSPPVAANRGILFADANNLFIAMDLNADGSIGACTCAGTCCADNSCTAACAGRNEFIFYSYNAESGAVRNRITRSVSCGGNAVILGTIVTVPPSAPTSNVCNGINLCNGIAGAGVALFRYYDRLNQEIPVTSLPARIPDIRSIKITIVTDTAANDTTQSGTPRPRRMIYSTSVIVRNHALSP